MSTDKDKSSTLHVSLKADSGYTSTETHRLSLDQWKRISSILNEEG